MREYNFIEIEKKWREKLDSGYINKLDDTKPKYYCLDMFPYPSSTGLHVGHWRGYVLSDVLSRYKLLQGYQVLHPMGWDAFGLPAENYAISVNEHPSKSVGECVDTYRRQLKDIGAIYNWDREVNTTDPNYYKWTQWIFVQMFKKGLAYEKEMPLNWCPECKTVLANEEAKEGVCERCKSPVTKKMLRQWMLKITHYADRLLEDLGELEWPEKVKKMQSDWIGKSYGAEVDFKLADSDEKIKVFTTRPDTLFGATFMVLAPEHPLVKEISTPDKSEEVSAYVEKTSHKSSVDRMSDKEKTGVFTGAYAINPLSGENVPVWISDYVLLDYGTGAIMCVPAHDQRDFDFAKKFELPIIQVLKPKDEEEIENMQEAFEASGILINSSKFNGLEMKDAIAQIIEFLEAEKIGTKTTNFKLRDWVFSRQRYWGEPIPLVHCEKCGVVPVKEEDLPVELPNVESYQPTNTGESPLADIAEWVNTKCPVCGGDAKRETNTMPQWAGSSWYFLRYADPHNNDVLASPENIKKWLPVDTYVGGIEHAVLHLLYARFYTKFLYDIGVVDFKEPFLKLFNQGMVLKNGFKMAKSKGNGVSPDELSQKFGADSLRMYELFIGPPELDMEWIDTGIEGVSRFLNRVWRLVMENKNKLIDETKEMEQTRHKMIYEITTRLNKLTMNTVVSGLMESVNAFTTLAKANGGLAKESLDTICTLLSPLAPAISEEMWEELGHTTSVFEEKWPTYDEEKMIEDTIEIAVQINGKYRASIHVSKDEVKDKVIEIAKESLGNRLDGLTIVKEIYVPGRIVNIVAK